MQASAPTSRRSSDPPQQDGGPELVQLLTPEGERVEHPEFSFGDGLRDDELPSWSAASSATWC